MIRQAQLEDAAQVISLIISAIHELTFPFTGEYDEDAAGKILTEYYCSPGNRFSCELVTVEEIDGQIAGMILCYYGKDMNELYSPIETLLQQRLQKSVTLELEADTDEYYIDALAVHPSYQGRGIASRLMQHIEQKAANDGVHKVGLNVDFDNAAAEDVYKRKGYVADKQIMLHHKPFWHMVKHV
ncbi:GNAT family N-acetyltransferase [Paenibacillus endoradicis]|uniref:GNAT family N-acetyltransferase n=1 Tax=Paenibacillus endoradicis TaxID=2972487 RepID=UPI0021593E5F|nr:GNAT family N-acetyltransferase [Paenibacillus endoradicis]MCR8658851.1 GNAT family N-acetyltransferase [Paenibacillus endoradicis]